MKKSNLVLGVIFLALSVYAYYTATNMVAMIPADDLGPGFWPKVLAVGMGMCSLVLIGQGIFSKEARKSPFDFRTESMQRVLKLCGLLALFAAVLFVFGFVVAALVLIPSCMFLLGERKRKWLVAVPVFATAFIFVVFGLVLRVPLPTGLFF